MIACCLHSEKWTCENEMQDSAEHVWLLVPSKSLKESLSTSYLAS